MEQAGVQNRTVSVGSFIETVDMFLSCISDDFPGKADIVKECGVLKESLPSSGEVNYKENFSRVKAILKKHIPDRNPEWRKIGLNIQQFHIYNNM